jgi:hypothetical protein
LGGGSGRRKEGGRERERERRGKKNEGKTERQNDVISVIECFLRESCLCN